MSVQPRQQIGEPLSLFTPVPPFGDVRAIQWKDGERYYVVIDDEDTVTLLDHATARQLHLDNYDGGQP